MTATVLPGRRAADERAELDRRFRTWHPPIPTLLGSVAAGDVLRHDIYRLPPLRTFVSARIALVGDAAHAMTPDFGPGGCTSVEDAVELARQLDHPAAHQAAGPAAALIRYDQLRRNRPQRIARQSALFGVVAQASTPGVALLRNHAIRRLPPAMLLRAVGPMLSWR